MHRNFIRIGVHKTRNTVNMFHDEYFTMAYVGIYWIYEKGFSIEFYGHGIVLRYEKYLQLKTELTK